MNYNQLQCILNCLFANGAGGTHIPEVDQTVTEIRNGQQPAGPPLATTLGIQLQQFFAPDVFNANAIWACIAGCIEGDPTAVPDGLAALTLGDLV